METALDPMAPESRVLFGIAEAEVAQHAQWRSSANVFAAVDRVLVEAGSHPEVFVDPVLLRGDPEDFGVRAAVADLAVRLNMAEGTVRDYWHIAQTLRKRTPALWAWFLDGEVSTQNARETAAVAAELPQQFWAEFEEQVVGPARVLAPARFRAKARGIRDRLQTATLSEKHEVAVALRRVWKESDRDGMAWLGAYLPAEMLELAMTRIDAIAFQLFSESDETRTMAQLRADVLADLLMGAESSTSVGISLALTIPVMALLGQSDEPAVLQGVGPIDLDTARRLGARSPSVTRLLTHPITGEILAMDPNQYRCDAEMTRWIRLTQPVCDFPNCGRPARQCDLDHTLARVDGGKTAAQNLSPRCRPHHGLKHQTKWQVTTQPGKTRPTWTSPTGHQRDADPPPF